MILICEMGEMVLKGKNKTKSKYGNLKLLSNTFILLSQQITFSKNLSMPGTQRTHLKCSVFIIQYVRFWQMGEVRMYL